MIVTLTHVPFVCEKNLSHSSVYIFLCPFTNIWIGVTYFCYVELSSWKYNRYVKRDIDVFVNNYVIDDKDMLATVVLYRLISDCMYAGCLQKPCNQRYNNLRMTICIRHFACNQASILLHLNYFPKDYPQPAYLLILLLAVFTLTVI